MQSVEYMEASALFELYDRLRTEEERLAGRIYSLKHDQFDFMIEEEDASEGRSTEQVQEMISVLAEQQAAKRKLMFSVFQQAKEKKSEEEKVKERVDSCLATAAAEAA